jgi:ABC-type lipoprotein release transport system permease subunit
MGVIHARRMYYDIAVLKARGLSRKGAISFIYLSISPIIILSIIIGVGVGLVTAYGLTRFFLSTFLWQGIPAKAILLTIFPYDLILIALTIIIFILSPLIPALIVSGKKPVEVLSRG